MNGLQETPAAAVRGWKKYALPAAGIAAGLLIATAAALCLAAGLYRNIFPGVTVGGISLGRQPLPEAQAALHSALVQRFSAQTVTVVSRGETLRVFTLEELGARADEEAFLEQAAAVGRAPGVIGRLKNGLTLARCLLGSRTEIPLTPEFDGDSLLRAAGEAAEAFDRAPLDGSCSLTEEGLFATRHRDGRALDREKLSQLLRSAPETVEAPYTVLPAVPLDLTSLHFPTQPASATVNPETGEVLDGTVGVSLDPEAARLALASADYGETIQLPATILRPEITAEHLREVLFRDLLSTASTHVSGSSSRRGNVRLAGESVNGVILNAGDIFDYNAVVGERTADRGFGAAPTYINGLTVNTVGGGICQVSSTLYLSALLANLEIVERHNHRYYPGYVPLGMDATVSWGGPEFRFANSTSYPIRVEVTYQNGVLTVNLYGTKTDSNYVKMTYETLSTTDYKTVYEETAALPYGEQQQKQNGYRGYKVKTYRNLYDGDGNLLSRTLESTSTYSGRDRIILVGTAGKPQEPVPSPEKASPEGSAAAP